MGLTDNKVTSQITSIQVLPTKPNASLGYSEDDMKKAFDQGAESLRIAMNGAIDDLVAATGAAEVGATAPTGLTGDTIQAIINAIATILDSNSSSISGLGTAVSDEASARTSADSTLSSQISGNASALTTHKGSGDHDSRYFTQTEVNALVSGVLSQVSGLGSDVSDLQDADSDNLKIATDQTVTGDKTFDGRLIKTSQPSVDADVANKAYVDAVVAGITLGQLADGSVTDAKLSSDAGMALDRISQLESSLAYLADNKATQYEGTGLTISTSGWAANAGDYPWKKDVNITGMLASDRAIVFIDKESLDTAEDIELSTAADTYAGGITFYAQSVPATSITFDWEVVRNG